MKKVLLATTILGMSAGFAAAEIAFTGTATTGYYSDAGADYELFNSFELAIAATGESDSGLSFGASASIATGTTWDLAGDFERDGSDTLDTKAKTLGTPKVFVSGDFGKITVKVNGFKEYQADNAEKYDLEYTHTIAGLSIGLRSDLTSENAATKGQSSVSLGYTVGGVALSANYDELNAAWGVSGAYTMNALTFTLAAEDKDVANSDVQSVKVAYSANGISASVKADTNDAITVAAGYSANGITVNAEAKDVKAGDTTWKVTGAYDLGGGLTAEAGLNGEEDSYLGVKMKF